MRRHSIFGKDNNAGEKLRQQEKKGDQIRHELTPHKKPESRGAGQGC